MTIVADPATVGLEPAADIDPRGATAGSGLPAGPVERQERRSESDFRVVCDCNGGAIGELVEELFLA